MLTTVAQAVVNGLLIGGIYALVSIGVTLIFGVVKIVNFAQGEFVMIGMYISFYLATSFGIDPLVSLVISMPALFVVGVLLQHFLIRRVLGLGDMPQIFLTFALSLLLVNLALLLFTANYRTVQTSYSETAIHLGTLYVPVAKLIAFAVAMALSGLLWAFLHATDIGKAMRAAAQNRDVAMLMGINPDRVFCVAVGVALALAGAAGSLLMPFYPAYPLVGQVFVLMAFVAVVLGTLGNITGALIASLMMGVAELLGIQFVGADSGLIVVFAMLLLTLAAAAQRPVRRGEPVMYRLVRRGGFWVGMAAAVALVLPLLCVERFRDRHLHQDVAVRIHRRRLEPDGRLCQAIIAGPRRLFRPRRIYLDDPAHSLWRVALDRDAGGRGRGDAGKPSDRRAVLPAARPIFRHRHDRDGASLDAAVSEIPRFRLGRRGHDYAQSGQLALMMQFEAKAPYYYVVLVLLAIGLGITYRIERSWMGYYLVAVGEDEDAAEADRRRRNRRIKRNIYLISAFFTAVAGTFYVQYIYFIDPNTAFSFNVSVEAALVSIVGGIGTLWGPVVGTVLLEPTSALVQSWLGGGHGGVQLTLYSVILIAVILWRPSGLIGSSHRRLWTAW